MTGKGNDDQKHGAGPRNSPEKGPAGARQRIRAFAARAERGREKGADQRQNEGDLDLSGLELYSSDLLELSRELAALPGVRRLNLNRNDLTTGREFAEAFKPLGRLTTLWLDNNRLTSTKKEFSKAFEKLPQLANLSVNNNRLTSTTELARAFEKVDQLTELHLDSNGLTSTSEFAQAFEGLPQLAKLSLNNNQLGSTTEFARAFEKLDQLTELHLSNNGLTSTTKNFCRAFERLYQLTKLSLSDNRLRSTTEFARAFEELSLLTWLNLSSNRLTSTTKHFVAAFQPLSRLTKLWLNDNQLRSTTEFALAFEKLSLLTSLNLSNNRINSTTKHFVAAFQPLRRLTELWLNDNRLRSTTEFAKAFEKLDQLTELHLNNNGLTSTTQDFSRALEHLTQLTKLSLNNNQLTSTTEFAKVFEKLTQLTKLDLNNNKLTSRSDLASAFRPLAQLTDLNLDSNRLTPEQPLADAIKPLERLNDLRLDDNPLQLDPEILRSRDLRQILRALEDLLAGKSVLFPEFKLVFLGQGRVGKTSLWRRLLGLPFRDPEPPTPSFEWRELPDKFRPGWPPGVGEQVIDGRVVKRAVETAPVHLFDFGGQDALWASHRFFVSARQAIFVIVVSRAHPLRESRPKFWLDYVDHVWQETLMTWSEQFRRRRIRDGAHDDNQLKAECDADALRLLPRPAVLVVMTNSGKNVLEPKDVEHVRQTCSERSTELVENYDSDPKFDPDGSRLAKVRDAIREIMHSERYRHVWITPTPSYIVERRARCRSEFGFGAHGLNPKPMRPWIDLGTFYSDVCGITGVGITEKKLADDRADARFDLGTLRDLGIVHWVGDDPRLPYSTDKIRDLIFSPAAIRRPVYNVLWSKYEAREPLTHEQIIGEIKHIPPDDPNQDRISPEDAALVLRLMIACELVFEVPDSSTTPPGIRYLVPDRFPSGELTIPDDTPRNDSETLFRADLKFIPHMLMPRLIGRLCEQHECRELARSTCTLDWKRGGKMFPVRLCADQTTGMLRAGITASEPSVATAIADSLREKIEVILGRPAGTVRLSDMSKGNASGVGTPRSLGRTASVTPGADPGWAGVETKPADSSKSGRSRSSSVKAPRPSPLRGLSVTLYKLVKSNSDAGVLEIGSWTDVAKHGMDLARAKEEWREQIQTLFDKKRKDKDGKAVEAHVWLEKCGDAIRTACQSSDLPRPLDFWNVQKDIRHLRRHDDGPAGSRKPLEDD